MITPGKEYTTRLAISCMPPHDIGVKQRNPPRGMEIGGQGESFPGRIGNLNVHAGFVISSCRGMSILDT
jgi:hypothetical protein